VVDFHSHAWPVLAQAPENAEFLQRHTIWHSQVARRAVDAAPIEARTLYDGLGGGRSNLLDVNFRFGSLGRAEWTADGIDYYLQWMPELMDVLVMPPELMIALMGNVGVQWGLVSRGHAYGAINDYVSDVVQQYPDRLVGCAQIEEWNASTREQQEELRRCVEELGLRALYFETEAFFVTDFSDNFDDRKFDPFWRVVADLEIPVLWDLRCRHTFTPEDFHEQVLALCRWATRWPSIPSVITHAFNLAWFRNEELSTELLELLGRPQVYLELLFPIMMGRRWEYPYPEAIEIIRRLREEVGTARFLWGSDMPAAQRVCTYRQALDYLVQLREFMPDREVDGILGGNAIRLLALEQQAKGAKTDDQR
jgi:predicted TIM-barrel fold metal-dependent hydrolase